ncbi:HK97 family phage prohead protease [Pseudonocardia abyssalis]|uniref:HK97 family phage prohead protease n=1 Tax=Pseudonocardia abyssalis TaxID=2792008 RepID=A0ABS6UX93_9PSEU|nr:HK97 family phage prohead protease [Pseudonocardia abyssalis]MBW0136854.1 HK97 family phage prohead protease [Pseudonocardia abyssalis]
MTLQRFDVLLRTELKGRLLRGHASVFDQAAQMPGHLEVISATAFKRVLDDAATDVRALWNHNPDHLLGRQSSGTLRLGTDSEGLEFEVDLPDTTLGRDVQVLAERGDISGASFAFVPGDDEWSTVEGRRVRTHTSVARLLDVSPVTFPAYEGASVTLRSFPTTQPVSLRGRLVLARYRALNASGGRLL